MFYDTYSVMQSDENIFFGGNVVLDRINMAQELLKLGFNATLILVWKYIYICI